MKIIAALFMLSLLTVSVHGSEYTFDENSSVDVYPDDELCELFDALPDDVARELEDYFASSDDISRVDELKEKIDIRYIAGIVWRHLTDIFPSWLGTLGTMLAVTVISSVVKNTLSTSMSEELCSGTVSLISVVSAGNVALKSARLAVTFISQLCTVMNAMIPVMSVVMLSGGGVTQASVNSGALMLYITVTQNITEKFLVPMAGALFALSTFSGIFKGVNVSSFISGVQRFLMTVFGFSMMIFSFVMGIQTSLASSADSLGMKTVRFAVGSYIPIVGGAVSEALSTVTAGLSHVRHMTGTLGVIIILLSVLPTIISLFMCRLSLLICKSVAETLECQEAASPMGDADKVLSLFLAFSAMSTVFFIFAIVLFMNSGLK